MEQHLTALKNSFAACSFAPADSGTISVAKTEQKDDSKSTTASTFATTSFFIDSSGRSSFTAPLELKFSSKKDMDDFLAAKCLDPPPMNLVTGASGETERSNFKTDFESIGPDDIPPTMLSFEVKSSPKDDIKEVTVEGVTILSCMTNIENLAISFQLKVTVRAVLHDDSLSSPISPVAFSSSPRGVGGVGGAENFHFKNDNDIPGAIDTAADAEPLEVVTTLQIIPVLTMEQSHPSKEEEGDALELLALKMVTIPDSMIKSTTERSQDVRLDPLVLTLTLTHAFTIFVKSVPGPDRQMGHTMVSLTIQHSNSHSERVTITNIALHPGHSREDFGSTGRGNEQTVVNMTKSVQWGFLPRTELTLPLVIEPLEAYSTILFVNAAEEMLSRSFVSPISVTGLVGRDCTTSSDPEPCRVVVAGDAHWTTELVAVEPADAFRIHMSVERSITRRGDPMIVKLRIFNLNMDTRNLMLLMAKDDANSNTSTPLDMTLKEESVNAAVVSEADGYTFGVWGICGDDDGTVRLNRDYELLAIDAALVLGTVEGQHAVDAELRFVPLQLGRLKVPNWKLYDKTSGRWYKCSHNLSMVAVEDL
ncbi:hypothetical protein IV203_034792 [Nitzschia inconspicua]|uniref:Uncharacterized protein n=1 Tax=Nitzschia inconspicua TaxID=303405 RepID=A0A9K3LDI0_9STRA|nr:hypothetical protein IV203_034792 [Nitzschia inconspicua]